MVVASLGVKGILPLSMLDWEGHIVSTLFMGGCNFRCPFCHNSTLVLDYDKLPDVSETEIRETLVSKRGWVDGVCITGGEPTISPSLFDVIELITDLEFKIKLDTNGSRPDIIKKIIDERLVDAIALDIKTSFFKYSTATRTEYDYSDEVKKSIRMLLSAQLDRWLDVEFRTTVVPNIVDHDDIIKIAKYLAEPGRHKFYLQQFDPKNVMVPDLQKIEPYPKEHLQKIADEASQFVPTFVRAGY